MAGSGIAVLFEPISKFSKNNASKEKIISVL